jgi:tRNA nucleotidyltransferase (CCA-adding enzyme)
MFSVIEYIRQRKSEVNNIRFNNVKEIEKYYQKQLSAGNLKVFKDIKTKGGKTLDVEISADLESAANALQNMIQNNLANYFRHYDPVAYHPRTGEFANSVMVEMTSDKEAKVYFGPGATRSERRAYLPALWNDGWKHKSGSHKDVYRFGWFEGTGFIDDAIEEAKKDKRFANIQITPVYGSPY